MSAMISYIGVVSDPGQIDEMVREIRAFASHMGWQTWTVAKMVEEGRMKDTGLRGITVSVDDRCEPLHFHLDDRGHFINHAYHATIHDAESRATFVEMMEHTIGFYPESIKKPGPEMDKFLALGAMYNWSYTQHGGPAAHVQSCTLIRFVRNRFAPDLQINDSTGYFEHGRLDELEKYMGEVDQTIRFFKRAAERVRAEGGSSDINGLVRKLELYVNEQRKMMD